MTPLENPECTECGERLSTHRLAADGGVACLRLRPLTKKEMTRSVLSPFDPLYGDERTISRRLQRVPMSTLVVSPLSHSPAAEAWRDAVFVKPVEGYKTETLPGLEEVR